MGLISKNRGTDEDYEKANLKGDKLNFALLTFLYMLQGTMVGLAHATPIIVQKRGATYEEQGEFNFSEYPYAMKILWAPIVDSIYVRKIGRRKTWLAITQLCAGAILFVLSLNVESWMGTEDGQRRPNVRILAVFFFIGILLNSIQDVAVDGWSLTLLQKRNVAYSAVCQSTGIFFGLNVMSASLIMLESKDFGNKFRSVFGFVPQGYGLVSFSEYFLFFSLTVLISTTVILIFKKEVRRRRKYTAELEDDYESQLSMGKAYALVWKTLKRRPVQMLILLLITRNIGVAPVTSVASLKLLDHGISRDTLATMSLLMFPIQLIIFFVLNRCLTGRRQLSLFLLIYVFRLVHSYVYAAFIYLLSYWKHEYNALPTWYFWPLLIIHNLQNISFSVSLVTLSVFTARISDPRFGGVYLTLFNSILNLGENWVSSVCLWTINFLSITSCSVDKMNRARVCHTMIDGFYVQVVVSSFFGVLWLFWARRIINYLENMDVSAFRVKQNPTSNKELLTLAEQPQPLIVGSDNSKTDTAGN